jgi:hypothetical protein
MHEYDAALKKLLTRGATGVLTRLTGRKVAHWHNSDLPAVRSIRADLLGETAGGDLVHVELQSVNDARIALRMLEYAVAIERSLHRFPEQLVLYVGEAPLRMSGRITAPGLDYSFAIVDIRELDSGPLIESRHLEDNVIAVLARLSGGVSTVRRILERIAENDRALRAEAVAELMILASLRSLGTTVRREIERMPILNDIMDHEVFGPLLRQGRAEGEREIVLALIGKRFGPVPAWARERIETLSAQELEQMALRLLDAASLKELLSE